MFLFFLVHSASNIVMTNKIEVTSLCYTLPEMLTSYCESFRLADELTKAKPRYGHLNTLELSNVPAVQERQPRQQHPASNDVTVAPGA